MIHKTEVDSALDADVVISMYNLAEYNDIYLKTLGRLWQCYRD